ncbi:MAG: PAS domain S-box protein, partial [Gemmatimonadetes bacterium]|nr:PAS domain S-box protein [Gemmatimonadota bacterium]
MRASPDAPSTAGLSRRRRHAKQRSSKGLELRPKESFDGLTRLAARLLRVPVVLISVLDGKQHRIQSSAGLSERWAAKKEIPLSHSFCQHVIGSGEALVVEDARRHPLLRGNPAIAEMQWIAYAGIPLRARGERVIGTLCAIDHLPREWAQEEIETLENLAAVAAPLLLETERAAEMARRSRREALLRKSEEQFRALIENAWDVIHLQNADGTIRYISPSVERVLGYTPAEMIGRRGAELVHPDDVEEATSAFETDIQHPGSDRNMELRLRHKDGSWRRVDIRGKIISDPSGAPVAVVHTHDVTERRRAEETRSRLAAIIESANEAIIGETLEGVITSWNPGAERMYGYSADEIVGKAISLIVPDDHPDELPAILERARSGERVDTYETVRVAKDGTRLTVALTVSPIFGAEGDVIGASAIARDITETKRTQEALRRKTLYLELLQGIAVAANQARAAGEAMQTCVDRVCAYTGW